jgi:molybdate transport system ATP-binding protein
VTLRFRAVLSERGLDVAFHVPEGGRLAILGPNGAGKSSVLSILAGTLVPDEGSAEVGGCTLFELRPGVRRRWVPAHERRFALLAQDPLLFPRLSVLDNVAFGPRSRGAGRADARHEASRRLEEVGVADLADRRPGEISGGQARRVAVARALAADPPLLLLDEPLAGIDADGAPALRALLRRVVADRPSVVVTHDDEDARVLADHVVVLERGRVVESGRTDVVLAGR